jgi:hypothetical protein
MGRNVDTTLLLTPLSSGALSRRYTSHFDVIIRNASPLTDNVARVGSELMQGCRLNAERALDSVDCAELAAWAYFPQRLTIEVYL